MPGEKAPITVRVASEDDLKQLKQIHTVINKAYRSEGGWTTEAHLVKEERITLQELEATLLDKVNPVLLAYDSETNLPLGTLQIETYEHYPDFGVFTGNGHINTYVDTVPKEKQAVLGLFSVHPEQQSRGIGRKLVEAALQHIEGAMDRTHAMVYVIVQRPELISWYTRLGFIDHGEKMQFPDASRLKDPSIHFCVLRRPLREN
ncbi:hypothetical protein DFQ26_005421 [Actinomortierella ambigua]|nr:hypothetical protein DFQ26_005421 [Actinomortierella ambigua]